jgi:hypothetical protein
MTKSLRALALSIGLIAGAATQVGAAVPGDRVEIPIKRLAEGHGSVRFGVDITVNGVPLEAQLDTGSSGVRILPSAGLPATLLQPTGKHSSETYGSGARIQGEIDRATVGLGSATADIPVELTLKAVCVPERPDCIVSRMGPDKFLLGTDTDGKGGYPAILGIGLRPTDVPNPLGHMGSARWIVELPLPGSAAPGRLIVNPTEEEQRGYTLYHLAAGVRPDSLGLPTWRDNELPACVVDLDHQRQDCAPTLLDTGEFGFAFARDDAATYKPWAAKAHAAIRFNFPGGPPVEQRFVTNDGPERHVYYKQTTTAKFIQGLNVGYEPFTAFSVLYDARNGVMGFKPR